MRLVSLTKSDIFENFKKMNKNTTKAYGCCMRRTHLTFIKICFVFMVCICLIAMVSCHTEMDDKDIDFKHHDEYYSHTERFNEDMVHEKYSKNHLTNLNSEDTDLNENIHLKDGYYTDYITNDNEKKLTKRRKHKSHKRMRNKNKHNKNKKNRNNDEISEISSNHVKSAEIKNEIQYIDSDKKYFDYFPSEKLELNSNETEENNDIKVIFLPINDDGGGNKNKKRYRKMWKKFSNKNNVKHERSKRSVTEMNTSQTDSSINNRNIDTNDSILPRVNLIRKIRDNSNEIEENGQYYSYGTNNDPWNNRFVKPLSRFQMPTQYTNPLIPGLFVKYPIPGIYHNPISPPGNYKSIVKRPPSTTDIPDIINNRFGEDRVIWDVIIHPTTRRPSFINQAPATRRTPPPLIHSVTEAPRPPATRRTQPPLIRNRVTDTPISTATRRTHPPLIRNTTERPTAPPTIRRTSPSTTSKPELSKCIWAIVSCCNRDNLTIRYSCFEQFGCYGAFWDLNPCAEEIHDSALSEAERFFNNQS